MMVKFTVDTCQLDITRMIESIKPNKGDFPVVNSSVLHRLIHAHKDACQQWAHLPLNMLNVQYQ